MYKNIFIWALLLLFFVPQTSLSQKMPQETLAILKKADTILAAYCMSRNFATDTFTRVPFWVAQTWSSSIAPG